MTEAESDKAYAAAFDAMQQRISKRVDGKCFLVFSAHKFDHNRVPIDNLDEVPIPGKVKIRVGRSHFSDGKLTKLFESEILRDPSWLDLCAIAHAHILRARDRTNRYLDTAEIVGNEGDVTIVRLCLGT
jgi:hypothetical protein